MKLWLSRFELLVLVFFVAASPLHAGQNAGASARIYWLVDNTTAATSPYSTAASVKALVTVRGIHNFRGADVQLAFGKASWYSYGSPPSSDWFLAITTPPQAWQVRPGGPAEANYTLQLGGFNGPFASLWPDVFKALPAVPSLAIYQDGSSYCCWTTGSNACVTPHGRGVIWLSAVGSAGVTRDPSVEYAVLGFTLDLSGSSGHLVGDDSNPEPVVIHPEYRLPCGSGEKGETLLLVDGAVVKDYAAFDYVHDMLYWHQELITPVKPATWSRLRKLYR
ncbi:MAG: hypothetical protein HZB25_12660 [Candidatus Eisenbacteria bacterium]|nr:hypothetical protein [Candidatus Eisenbacteria bacterium]